jgi:hypothetical protein
LGENGSASRKSRRVAGKKLSARGFGWGEAAAPEGGSIMTVLGKILAIVNLVLSLAVGAFIAMTYVGRTNWHAAYESKAKQAEVSEKDARAFQSEMKKVQGEKAQLVDQLAKSKDAANKEKQDLNAQVADHSDKLKQAREEIAKHVAAQDAAGQELKRRAGEVDHFRTLVATRDEQLRRWEKQVQDMRAAMMEAKINYDAERGRNERLLQENERLTKDNQQIRQVASSTSLRTEAPKKNPPAEEVGGRITRTDPQSGLVTINVGSDAGLIKGNTLDVFRLKPDPAYLGTIRILAVRPNEAVGQPIGLRPGVIKEGDQVSSNVMSRR